MYSVNAFLAILYSIFSLSGQDEVDWKRLPFRYIRYDGSAIAKVIVGIIGSLASEQRGVIGDDTRTESYYEIALFPLCSATYSAGRLLHKSARAFAFYRTKTSADHFPGDTRPNYARRCLAQNSRVRSM
jgi:hypothetical protein